MKKRFLFLFLAVLLSITGFSQINSGSPTIPFGSNTGYQYGLMPTNVNMSVITSEYNTWKSSYVATCTNGRGARIRFDNPDETVSEGVAYGMLLAVYAGDKTLFDDLWTYYTSFLNGNGFMHWKIDGCNSANGLNGATDADLDAAMALILALEQWPNSTSPHNYRTAAETLINNIRNHQINHSNYQTLNGDAWFNNNCLNPSYQSPAYYRQFATFMPNHAGFWGNVTNAAESLLLANRNPNNGLVGNWCDASGVSNACANTTPNEYGWDAIRTPWRMTVDVLWHGAQTADAAYDICSKMTGWLTGHETNITLPMSQNAANASQGA